MEHQLGDKVLLTELLFLIASMNGLFKGMTVPRWTIFLVDIIICAASLCVAYLLRFNFQVPAHEIALAWQVFWLFLLVRAASLFIGKVHKGIIRYTGSEDARRIFFTVSIGTGIFFLFNLFRYQVVDGKYFLPRSVLIIDYLVSLFILVGARIAVKFIYFEMKHQGRDKLNVIVYGAGEAGLIAKRTLDRDMGTRSKVMAFVDDDKAKTGKRLEGVRIDHSSKLPELLSGGQVDQVIISIKSPNPENKRRVIQACLEHNTQVLTIPPPSRWIKGELSFNQIRNVRIEDLLGREVIKLDKGAISKCIAGRRVLVTGAAGSIGSELVRQVLPFGPAQIVLLDQAESPLYEMELEVKQSVDNATFVIGDVRDSQRMRRLFEATKPEIIFHAAAYKHVPLMEENPAEAVRTNVLGTKVLVDLALEHQVKEFVLISTDKAVNPTSVMGASKRAAEIYAQAAAESGNTKFITTRFGNVLGSNGSVIPLFRKQIAGGGPITVTDPEVTRFFMTIPEACQLVLEAAAMGQGKEIFVFDMGTSVKIVDLARQMIKLSGLELGKDIEILFTGLRPGEKLYEELLATEENSLPTHHPQILIGKVKEYPKVQIDSDLGTLHNLVEEQRNEALVAKLKEMIPEYVSNNSTFVSLDKAKQP